LKPENILLDSPARRKVKIADFGLAKNNRNTMTRGVGTPVYVPPEMFDEGSAQTNMLAVDIYALGVILWQLWFKMPPFDRLPLHTVRARVTHGPRLAFEAGADGVAAHHSPPPLPLVALIERCWAQAPEHRPPAAEVYRAFHDDVSPAVKAMPAAPPPAVLLSSPPQAAVAPPPPLPSPTRAPAAPAAAAITAALPAVKEGPCEAAVDDGGARRVLAYTARWTRATGTLGLLGAGSGELAAAFQVQPGSAVDRGKAGPLGRKFKVAFGTLNGQPAPTLVVPKDGTADWVAALNSGGGEEEPEDPDMQFDDL
jgi:hypothetical protein